MIYVALFHGRENPHQELDDWGFSGPVLGPFKFLQWTYGAIRLCPTPTADEELTQVSDMIFYDGAYYGDFSVLSADLVDSDPNLKSRVQEFDPEKGVLR